jgi:archaellum component FlaC
MVFGGTRIEGASNISKALARRAASEVAGKITQSVSAEDALATLSTAAEKLLKGKRLAIYDRTSNNTPRFARQYLISHERATHTVAVVRSLFAKASEGIAHDGQRELQAELDAYLKTDDQAIRGGKLKELVDRLKTARQPAAAPQSHETQAEVAGNLAPALGLAQAELKLQLPSISQAPEPDLPGQAPKPQLQQPMGLEKGVEWQGLPLASENERPRSQELPKPGELADPAIALPQDRPGAVPGKIEKELESTEEAFAPAHGMASASEMNAELEGSQQLGASFEEPISPRQSAAGLVRQSGELLLQDFAEDQERQLFMGGDDAGYQDYNFGRRDSIRDFEDEEFDANALDRRSIVGQPGPELNSFSDDEDDDGFATGHAGLSGLEQISPREVLAARQVKEVAAKQAQEWSEFVDQVDEYSERVFDWQVEFGRSLEGEPGDLDRRPLLGLAASLRTDMNKLEDLLDVYDGRPAQLSELQTLQRAVAEAAEGLDVGLGDLAQKHDALLVALDSVRERFEKDANAQDVVKRTTAQTELILGDLEKLMEPYYRLMADPDPKIVAQRQDEYQADMLDYPDKALGKAQQSWEQLDLQGLESLQADLKARVDSGKSDLPNLQTIAQIRKTMKTQSESMNRLQAELRTVQDDLSQVRKDIIRDFGSTDAASQRMQAAVDRRLNDVAQLRQQLDQRIAGINQALDLKVKLPAKVSGTTTAPSNANVAGLQQTLRNFNSGSDPQKDLDTYDQNLIKLLNTLSSGATLNRNQVTQLTADLKPQGPVASKLSELARILMLTVTNERDAAINKVMTEHGKRVSDEQQQNREALRKKEALAQTLQRRAQRIVELRDEIRALNKAEDSPAQVAELEIELRLQFQGGQAPDTDGMSAEWAEQAQWNAMPLGDIEAELATQDQEMKSAQAQEQLGIRDQQRAIATLHQDAEVKLAVLQRGLEERLQELAEATAQLEASGRA